MFKQNAGKGVIPVLKRVVNLIRNELKDDTECK